ncbi:hypothetical protein FDN13_07145 [Caloramator sp. E03]|uniref:hypothetical protein n=1 Tax=Caloramator sp. E03 TaxID=2576307 RepID=UPI0011104662|nr:hypothetical protein [Caloramator sp. E03]QCX33503.1 hypothetical protein FDN13_07145 [Caloramator sp. E03]
MSLTLEEKETIIIFNEKDKEAEIFTYNKPLIRKLKKYAEANPEGVKFKKDNGDGGLTFIVLKNWLSVRPPRKLSTKQKEILVNRLKGQF